ncbi:hypothetical protein niasHT_032584 [Heterodera trifolii]|uniref:Peptidase S1 domain-containing protein n=1 Tax=Heterodera trifolii TaxID=157864 RepID=A0ABD2IJS6_9BILA
MEVTENGPKTIKFKLICGNCSSFLLCYKSAFNATDLPWKLAKRFRFNKMLSSNPMNSNGDGDQFCGQNDRKIQFLIKNESITIGGYQLFSRSKPDGELAFALQLDQILGKVFAFNLVEQKPMNISNEFFDHSNFGSFLTDYAGLWLLPADIAPKLGQKSTKLTFAVPDDCIFMPNRTIVPPLKCHTFNFEAVTRQLGRDKRRINPLIYNGTKTDIKHLPWTVYFEGLRRYNATANIHESCTASLISSQFVLLAAHCLIDVYKIILGFNSTSNKIDDKKYDGFLARFLRSNSNVFIHPKYLTNAFFGESYYDLALIKIPDEHVEFTSKLPPICLHCGSIERFKNGTSFVAGWGKLDDEYCGIPGGDYPDDLRGRKARLIPCPEEKLQFINICLEEASVEQGDSGGALLASNGTHFVQIGVTSVAKCLPIVSISVYNMYSRLDGCWIEEIAGIKCAK